nr:MAG TPA: hypothetical protein [Caudoviricetes sp.]
MVFLFQKSPGTTPGLLLYIIQNNVVLPVPIFCSSS